jgi:tetratricopeptide (TPR) repeat protein
MLSNLKYIPLSLILIFLIGCPTGPYIKIKETIEELQASIQEDPNNPVAYYNLGLGYTSKKKYEEALDSFHKALEIEPHFSDAYFAIYCVKYSKDKKLYSKALSENPSPEVRNKIDEVDSYLEAALMYDPFFDWKLSTILLDAKPTAYDNPYLSDFINKVYNFLLEGFIQFSLGNYDKAVKKFDYVIVNFPEFTQAYLIRGFAQAILGKYDDAIKDFEFVIAKLEGYNEKKVLPIYLNPAELYYLIAFAYLKQENLDKAEEKFKKVIMENMGFYMAHYQLSNICKQRGNYTGALQEVNAAIIANPDNPVFHFSKGVCLNTISRDWEAMEEFRKAISLNPKYPKSYYTLAVILESIKNNEEAVKNYQSFIERAPKSFNDFIEKAQTRIKILEKEQTLQKN